MNNVFWISFQWFSHTCSVSLKCNQTRSNMLHKITYFFFYSRNLHYLDYLNHSFRLLPSIQQALIHILFLSSQLSSIKLFIWIIFLITSIAFFILKKLCIYFVLTQSALKMFPKNKKRITMLMEKLLLTSPYFLFDWINDT